MEFWIEANLHCDLEAQSHVLLDVLRPYVERLKKSGRLVTWHFFREPEIRFRVRLKDRKTKTAESRAVASMADSLVKQKLVSSWHFGNHGEGGKEYSGEEDRYGRNGWKVAQDYFNSGAETALRLLALKREKRLEDPLWAKGLGNPWEGGEANPWKERQEDPLVFQWSRYVHLFTNQLGFDMEDEVRLCSRQAERYRMVTEETGMKW
jgi:hypothetical protein